MADQRWTARRRKALEAYVADLAKLLKLSDWTIKVVWEAPAGAKQKHLEDDQLATITPVPSSKHAHLRVSDELLKLSAAEQTQALCHEMVHCHLFALMAFTETTFELLKSGERRAAEPALSQHMEAATDGLADAFAPMVPLLCLDQPTAKRSTKSTSTGAR